MTLLVVMVHTFPNHRVVIVEDVLVLVCELLVRHGRLVHLTFLGPPGPPAVVNELVEDFLIKKITQEAPS